MNRFLLAVAMAFLAHDCLAAERLSDAQMDMVTAGIDLPSIICPNCIASVSISMSTASGSSTSTGSAGGTGSGSAGGTGSGSAGGTGPFGGGQSQALVSLPPALVQAVARAEGFTPAVH
jgi:hypothetical protein